MNISKLFQVDFAYKCPCGKTFLVDSTNFAIIHEMPPCAKFIELELDQYLKYVRQATTSITDN